MAVPRSTAPQEIQDEVRREVIQFGPVKFMVSILQTSGWDQEQQKENETKLKYAARMLDKVSSNLRHTTRERIDLTNRPLDQYTSSELFEAIAKKSGVEFPGEGVPSQN